ncbi:MAG: hypothetical protein M3Q69_17870 [Acidobacteriota bacterium]|nr:hypothetical protein [Acidobacteriota bacterium]
MRVFLAVLLHLVFAPFALALTPRITFERILPAQVDLGHIEEVAVVDAAGEPAQVETFVGELLHDLTRSQLLRARDIRNSSGPADAHLDVKSLACTTTVREGEGSARDVDGNKTKKHYASVDATCIARIDVLTRFMKFKATFFATGAGTSSRMDAVTEEARADAIDRALRHAANEAAARMTPRRVRESIALDDTAPAFVEGMSMIEAGRFAEARTMWEAALRTGATSAALRYNLGAVCEALGDRRAAELHYNAARQLAPERARYAEELKLFVRRARP